MIHCSRTINEAMKTYNTIEENCGSSISNLDKVYHSESMHEMEVNADLLGVDLCNPYVLLFLAEQTAYHHAFWPHTKKRFIAFKNILRRNRQVKESLQDFAFYSLIDSKLKQLESQTDNPLYFTPGGSKEIENIQQVISIVEKSIAESK